MRVQTQNQQIENVASTSLVKQTTSQTIIKQPEYTTLSNQLPKEEEQTISKERLQQAVQSMNELLEINQNSSKFVYHEGLDRYYVTVVDKDTEEVIKEIPPKKLLDAFYEMQKLVGMMVDEKI